MLCLKNNTLKRLKRFKETQIPSEMQREAVDDHCPNV